jgi:hypothetical protein
MQCHVKDKALTRLIKSVTRNILGIHSTSLVTGKSVTLLTASEIFFSKLLTSTPRHLSRNIF